MCLMDTPQNKGSNDLEHGEDVYQEKNKIKKMIHIWKKGGDFNEEGYMGI